MTMEERMEFLTQSIESHDRQIGELTEQVNRLGDKIDKNADAIAKLVAVTNDDATAIRALVRIAEAHEARIANLEKNPEE